MLTEVKKRDKTLIEGPLVSGQLSAKQNNCCWSPFCNFQEGIEVILETVIKFFAQKEKDLQCNGCVSLMFNSISSLVELSLDFRVILEMLNRSLPSFQCFCPWRQGKPGADRGYCHPPRCVCCTAEPRHHPYHRQNAQGNYIHSFIGYQLFYF